MLSRRCVQHRSAAIPADARQLDASMQSAGGAGLSRLGQIARTIWPWPSACPWRPGPARCPWRTESVCANTGRGEDDESPGVGMPRGSCSCFRKRRAKPILSRSSRPRVRPTRMSRWCPLGTIVDTIGRRDDGDGCPFAVSVSVAESGGRNRDDDHCRNGRDPVRGGNLAVYSVGRHEVSCDTQQCEQDDRGI